MTFSRYKKLVDRREERPPIDVLLTYVAAAHGYKLPEPAKTGKDAAADLLNKFPGGKIAIG